MKYTQRDILLRIFANLRIMPDPGLSNPAVDVQPGAVRLRL